MNLWKTWMNLYIARKLSGLSVQKMQALQNKKLRKMLHYVWKNSAFYRDTFEKANIKEEDLDALPMSCFPVLDKKTLFEHFDELITAKDITQEKIRRFDEKEHPDRKPYRNQYHIVHSSGSTGIPSYFLYDEEAWSQMLTGIIRAALWNMSMLEIVKLLWKKPRIVYIAATDGRYGGAMAVGDGIDGLGASQMYLDIKEPLEEWIPKVRAFKPNFIIGYPSAIKVLADLVENHQMELHITRVVSCGEPLGISLRRYLEQAFQAQVVNFYGASESLALGVESDIEEGMLLFDDMNYIEIEQGKMYLTCLYNFSQPLIRYQLSDRLTLKKATEQDRYPYTKAIGLLGREEDVMWFQNESGKRDFLHPLVIEGFCIQGLKDYQFWQRDPQSFVMEAEVEKNIVQEQVTQEIVKCMSAILAEKKMDYVQFQIHYVEEILPDTETGKKPLIIQKNAS